MNSDKEKAILHVANNMINSMNLQQIVEICRDFSFLKAQQYYEGLSEEEQQELEKKVAEHLKSQPEAQPS